ncbi:MAG: hypothetical protein MJZ76_05785 [Bacteroidales bacterium]|nr:hypothetical protein [Bacteroidales bacterium]
MLRNAFKKYLFRLLVFSIVLTSGTFCLQFIAPQYVSPALPYIVLFFFVVMMVSHYIILRGLYLENKKFEANYMLATGLKFISYLLFLLIYILLNRSDAVLFGISFIILYFLYSIFEIITIKLEKTK